VSAYRFILVLGHRPPRSLSARGQFLNAFAGIVYCLAFSLLALGGYGIEEQFANPVQAQAAGLLFSALLIATAVTLLYCLLHPCKKMGPSSGLLPAIASWSEKGAAIVRSAAGSQENRKPMPLHGRYVDRALVRIQR
jgi:hypothetical protein